jgi:hypothetical protein
MVIVLPKTEYILIIKKLIIFKIFTTQKIETKNLFILTSQGQQLEIHLLES